MSASRRKFLLPERRGEEVWVSMDGIGSWDSLLKYIFGENPPLNAGMGGKENYMVASLDNLIPPFL